MKPGHLEVREYLLKLTVVPGIRYIYQKEKSFSKAVVFHTGKTLETEISIMTTFDSPLHT